MCVCFSSPDTWWIVAEGSGPEAGNVWCRASRIEHNGAHQGSQSMESSQSTMESSQSTIESSQSRNTRKLVESYMTWLL